MLVFSKKKKKKIALFSVLYWARVRVPSEGGGVTKSASLHDDIAADKAFAISMIWCTGVLLMCMNPIHVQLWKLNQDVLDCNWARW